MAEHCKTALIKYKLLEQNCTQKHEHLCQIEMV